MTHFRQTKCFSKMLGYDKPPEQFVVSYVSYILIPTNIFCIIYTKCYVKVK